MKKFVILLSIGLGLAIAFNSFKSPKPFFKEPIPPSGYTGAPTQNRTCVNCHGDFSLNPAGGSVYANGLPTTYYVPGQSYNFTITISNASPMQLWGFAIKAVVSGTSGTALGTFSTTNTHATVSSGELKDNVAVSFNGNSYTYSNLTWTAPASGSSAVSFYITGVAADNDGSEAGDYVYSNSILTIPIPVTLGELSATYDGSKAMLEWHTFTETGASNFEIERSIDGLEFTKINSVAAAGTSNSVKYYSYADANIPANTTLLYYRIRMLDANGASKYSKVVPVKVANHFVIENVYAISGGQIHCKVYSDNSQPVSIGVYTVNGIKISTYEQVLTKGSNSFDLYCKNVQLPGIYYVKIVTRNFSGTRKILVP